MELILTSPDDEDFFVRIGTRATHLEMDQVSKYPFEIGFGDDIGSRYFNNKEVLLMTKFLVEYCAEKNLLNASSN